MDLHHDSQGVLRELCEYPLWPSQSVGPGVQRRQGPCLSSLAAKRPPPCQFEGARIEYKSTFLEGLVGIFQEQLHPAGEFHSRLCCSGSGSGGDVLAHSGSAQLLLLACKVRVRVPTPHSLAVCCGVWGA